MSMNPRSSQPSTPRSGGLPVSVRRANGSVTLPGAPASSARRRRDPAGAHRTMRALAWNPERAMHEPTLLDEINSDLEHRSAEDRVRWALDHLPGEHALSSSFG